MKIYEIESNGEIFTFNVINDTTKPCPHCGIPACGKQDIVWYEKNDKKFAIIFDGELFDLALEELFTKNKELVNFVDLPFFLKEWLQHSGWADNWDYNGFELQIDDFLEALELLKNCKMGKWITEQDIFDIQNLASTALEIDAQLKIVRG